MMSIIRLKELLRDWEDPDVAQYYLACCVGLMPFDKEFTHFRSSKHLFWTDNAFRSFLAEILGILVVNKVLEFDENESKYRWNDSFHL